MWVIPIPPLLHSPVTSSLLGPNILLNTLFSNTLNFLSSRNVSDQVSHPYKTTDKIIVLYILIFKFLDSSLEDKRCKLCITQCNVSADAIVWSLLYQIFSQQFHMQRSQCMFLITNELRNRATSMLVLMTANVWWPVMALRTCQS